MPKDELIKLRGGTESQLSCRVDGVVCWQAGIDSCDYARSVCDLMCGNWTEAICVGY